MFVRAGTILKRHLVGDHITIADHGRLAWLLAFLMANIDLSVPAAYIGLLRTPESFAPDGTLTCKDVFISFGQAYFLIQVNFLQPLISGM